MSPDPSAEERLFLILRGGPGLRPDVVRAQPARIRRPRRTAVDNVPPPSPPDWTPPPWPDSSDHVLALTAHAHRVRVGGVVTTDLEEL